MYTLDTVQTSKRRLKKCLKEIQKELGWTGRIFRCPRRHLETCAAWNIMVSTDKMVSVHQIHVEDTSLQTLRRILAM